MVIHKRRIVPGPLMSASVNVCPGLIGRKSTLAFGSMLDEENRKVLPSPIRARLSRSCAVARVVRRKPRQRASSLDVCMGDRTSIQRVYRGWDGRS